MRFPPPETVAMAPVGTVLEPRYGRRVLRPRDLESHLDRVPARRVPMPWIRDHLESGWWSWLGWSLCVMGGGWCDSGRCEGRAARAALLEGLVSSSVVLRLVGYVVGSAVVVAAMLAWSVNRNRQPKLLTAILLLLECTAGCPRSH
jgi:hypothetical protein